MSQQFYHRETPEEHEEVVVTKEPGVVHRSRVVHNTGLARRDLAFRMSQVVWLMFGILEALILLRIGLKLIAANPGNPFADFVYSITDLFLWPFMGLTVTPQAGGMVLELSSIIALFVYALLAWVIVKILDLMLYRTPNTHVVEHYEDDDRVL